MVAVVTAVAVVKVSICYCSWLYYCHLVLKSQLEEIERDIASASNTEGKMTMIKNEVGVLACIHLLSALKIILYKRVTLLFSEYLAVRILVDN
jgi:hypothetical protein